MNKYEELKKEAEEYYFDRLDPKAIDSISEINDANTENLIISTYLASAEPREKQIQIDAEQIRALQIQNGELTDRVKELEAEVKEWKDKADLWCKTANLKDHNIMINKELKKENAELKEKVSFLEDNLRVARKDREDLQLDVAKGLKEFVKDYPATALRYLANEKYVEQLTKAKKIIKILADDLSIYSGNYQKELLEARQFLSEVRNDN